MSLELIVPPGVGDRCALCWARFRLGDSFTTVWPKRGGGLKPALRLHPACLRQLAPGDLTRLFAALEGRLALPLRVLRGRSSLEF